MESLVFYFDLDVAKPGSVLICYVYLLAFRFSSLHQVLLVSSVANVETFLTSPLVWQGDYFHKDQHKGYTLSHFLFCGFVV